MAKVMGGTVKVGGIHATISGDSTELEKSLKRADMALSSTQAKMNRTLAAMQKSFNSLDRSVMNVMGPVFSLRAAFAVLAGGAAMAGIQRLLDSIGSLGEKAEQLGISTDGLQAFQYAATQAGISAETLETSIAKFTRTIGEAADGSKPAIDAFEALGVKILDASGKTRDSEVIMSEVAEALMKIESPAIRAARAADLFGKSGQKLLPLLSGGAAGLQRFRDEAAQLGLILDSSAIRDADLLSDRLAGLQLEIQKLAQSFAPALFDDLQLLLDFVGGKEINGSGYLADVLRNTRNEIELIGRVTRSLKDGSLFGGTELEKAVKELADMENLMKSAAAWGRDLTLSPKFLADLEAARARVERLRAQMAQSGFEQDETDARRHKLPAVVAPGVGNPLPATASSARGQAAREMEEYLAGLRQSAQLAGMEANARQQLEAVLRAENIARREGRALRDDERAQIVADVEAAQRNGEALQHRNQLVAEARQLYEQTRTPAEQYADTLARIDEIERAYPEAAEAANRARQKALETYQQAQAQASGLTEIQAELGSALQTAFNAGVSGAQKFEDVLKGLLKQVIQIILRLIVMRTLAAAFGVGSGPNSVSPGIGASGGAGLFAGLHDFARGGSFRVGGVGGTDSQMVAFNATPGELVDVRTPGQAGRRGGDVVVNVVNNTGDGVRQERSSGPDGQQILRIIIGEVDRSLRHPGAQLNRALQDTFGARPSLTSR
ncbi:MAG: phage tail tape measure protein [Reyranellaceae bacterium]